MAELKYLCRICGRKSKKPLCSKCSIGDFKKRPKRCLSCKEIFVPRNRLQKYCRESCVPGYNPKPKLLISDLFDYKYPMELVIDNIQKFYRLEDLTMPINVFKNHSFVKFAILSDIEINGDVCRQFAHKYIKIPKGQICEICKEREAKVRHHPDYSKPLFVRFLCCSCHVKIHKTKGFYKKLEIA